MLLVMAENTVYALNRISGQVSLVDASFIGHPTLGVNLVEVLEPDACIPCGDKPTSVTTVDGELVDISTQKAVNPKPPRRRSAAKPKPAVEVEPAVEPEPAVAPEDESEGK